MAREIRHCIAGIIIYAKSLSDQCYRGRDISPPQREKSTTINEEINRITAAENNIKNLNE
jgi:hypothetical protein